MCWGLSYDCLMDSFLKCDKHLVGSNKMVNCIITTCSHLSFSSFFSLAEIIAL